MEGWGVEVVFIPEWLLGAKVNSPPLGRIGHENSPTPHRARKFADPASGMKFADTASGTKIRRHRIRHGIRAGVTTKEDNISH